MMKSLVQEIQRQHEEECDCPPKPKFRTAEWDRENGDCDCSKSSKSSPSKSRQNTNNSLRLIESFVDLIKSDSTIEYALRQASNCDSSCGPKLSFGVQEKLFSHVGLASPLMREEYVWEKVGENHQTNHLFLILLISLNYGDVRGLQTFATGLRSMSTIS